MKSPVTAIVAIIAALMILGVIAYQLTAPGPDSGVAPPGYTSGSAPLAPEDGTTSSFDVKFAQIHQRLDAIYSSQQAEEVVITLSQPETNEAASRLVRQSDPQIAAQVKSVSVVLQGGNALVATVNGVSLGIRYAVHVKCLVQVKDGALSVEVVSVQAPFFLSQFKGSIAETVRQKTVELLNLLAGAGPDYAGKLDIRYLSVETADDSITVRVWAVPLPNPNVIKGS